MTFYYFINKETGKYLRLCFRKKIGKKGFKFSKKEYILSDSDISEYFDWPVFITTSKQVINSILGGIKGDKTGSAFFPLYFKDVKLLEVKTFDVDLS